MNSDVDSKAADLPIDDPFAAAFVEEDVRVRQVVKISYFKTDDMVVKSMADDQLWEYDPELHTWQLLTGLPKFK